MWDTFTPGCDSGAVEIMPISAKFFTQPGVTLQRTQLPLLPCWAATIHTCHWMPQ